MTTPDVPQLPSLLARDAKWNLQLDTARTEQLKSASRFWFQQKGPTTRDSCKPALARLFANPTEMTPRLATLSAMERSILEVFVRYGGAVSGMILRTELLTRGIVTLQRPGDERVLSPTSRQVPYVGLENKFLLLPVESNRYITYYSYAARNRYMDMVANPVALSSVTAAKPAPWHPNCAAPAPSGGTRCAFAEFVLNLWTAAQELARNNGWKPNRTGTMPKVLLNKIRKLLPQPTADLPTVPDLPELYCELLKGLGAISSTKVEGHIDLDLVQKKLNAPTEQLAFTLTKFWQYISTWHDGVGNLDDRDADLLKERLQSIRELLAWGLAALARNDNGDSWFDLESFLRQLWDIQQEDSPYFAVVTYDWMPAFASKQPKADASMVERSWTFWISGAGTCCANAILGTLVHMGLVERGPITDRGPLVFRLTALGRIVFGSPDVPGQLPATAEAKFLTVQPNFEVMAFIDDVPTQSLLPLARFARRTSGAGSKVHTFVMDRESVYHAMEAGFTVDRMREYLTTHARNALAPNVLRTLEEWGGKRDSLVLRRGVSLLVGVTSPPKNARAVGEGFHLLDGSATLPKGVLTLSYPDRARPRAVANEDGIVQLDPNADLIAVARLQQLADATKVGELKISQASIVRAKKRGIAVEQMLTRLSHHHRGAVPAMMEVAIRNWAGGSRALLSNLLMLQVPDETAATALLGSIRFKPFIVRHIPPDWFVMDGKHRKELETLLASIGYTLTTDV